jgi:hypothetical protein
MHDYDVGAINLSVPPPSAVLQSYRPAVLVRNNGVHDALASGTLRIYGPAGLLIFTTEIYSGTIAPGNSEPAQATDYWTPPAIGRYQVIAYVSCPLDQYEPNNNLAPCFVDVTGAPPPPPPGVPLHAAQHEDGGADEVLIDGLHGKLADAQTPLAHKTSHQVAGADALNVSGLQGILAQGQPLADHRISHENGGGDELNVEALQGELWNKQKPKTHANEAHDPNYAITPHGNEAHDPDYVSTAVLQAHQGAETAHEVAENLEQLAHKGEPDGYPELDEYGHVPPERLGTWTTPPPAADKALTPAGIWDYPTPAAHHESHESGGDDEISIADLPGVLADPQKAQFLSNPGGYVGIAGGAPETTIASISIPVSYLNQQAVLALKAHGYFSTTPSPGQILHLRLNIGGSNYADLAYALPIAETLAKIVLLADLVLLPTNQIQGFLTLLATPSVAAFTAKIHPFPSPYIYNPSNVVAITLTVLFATADAGTGIAVSASSALSYTNQL